MKKLVAMLAGVLYAFLAYADCGRLTATDTYEKLNTILACIESKIPDTIMINNGAIFIPGDYQDARGVQYVVSGGGTVGTDRATWSVRSKTSPYIFNAAWTTGPVEGHPQVGAMAIAPKLPKNVPFGIIGEVSSHYLGWKKGGVIAAIQTGGSVTIWAYHEEKSDGSNLNYPSTNLVLTRIEPQPQKRE